MMYGTFYVTACDVAYVAADVEAYVVAYVTTDVKAYVAAYVTAYVVNDAAYVLLRCSLRSS